MSDLSEGPWAYIAVFVGLIMAGMGFPIPEEVPVIAGGGFAPMSPPPLSILPTTGR